jgi:hypothetical protein
VDARKKGLDCVEDLAIFLIGFEPMKTDVFEVILIEEKLFRTGKLSEILLVSKKVKSSDVGKTVVTLSRLLPTMRLQLTLPSFPGIVCSQHFLKG